MCWQNRSNIRSQHQNSRLETARAAGDGHARGGGRLGRQAQAASVPITPFDSPAKRCAQSEHAAAAADPPTLVTVPPPTTGGWCDSLRPTREEGKFIDITLLVGGRKIPAHKAVIVSLSPYLDGLLTSGLAESSAQAGHETTVGDESTDGRAVEAIVDLMYSGQLALSASTVGSVIRTANLLQVGAAEKAACDFFVESLEPSTASDALSFAASFAECGAHARELYARCVGYAVDQFEECSEEESFVELPCEAVAELIASEDLPCEEAAVVEAVRAWFTHDAAGRAGALKSLVPLIRWPLLSVATRLQLQTETLLLCLMKQDVEGLELGVKLLLECSPDFAKSDAAAACPRLRRRKGSPQPVGQLAFTAFDQDRYVVTEGGALLTSTEHAFDHPAFCSEVAMNGGLSCAEFTVLDSQNMTIGVARPTLDLEAEEAILTDAFWGVYSESGDLYNGGAENWQGQQPYATGDVVQLLLDSDAGTLTVKKNGDLLGVAMAEGLTGDMYWAVCCVDEGNSVRIKAVDPVEF